MWVKMCVCQEKEIIIMKRSSGSSSEDSAWAWLGHESFFYFPNATGIWDFSLCRKPEEKKNRDQGPWDCHNQLQTYTHAYCVVIFTCCGAYTQCMMSLFSVLFQERKKTEWLRDSERYWYRGTTCAVNQSINQSIYQSIGCVFTHTSEVSPFSSQLAHHRSVLRRPSQPCRCVSFYTAILHHSGSCYRATCAQSWNAM